MAARIVILCPWCGERVEFRLSEASAQSAAKAHAERCQAVERARAHVLECMQTGRPLVVEEPDTGEVHQFRFGRVQ